jgi:hypothetical protein
MNCNMTPPASWDEFDLMNIPVRTEPQYGWQMSFVNGASLTENISGTPGVPDGSYQVTSIMGSWSWGPLPGTVVGNGLDLFAQSGGLSADEQRIRTIARGVVKIAEPGINWSMAVTAPQYLLLGGLAGAAALPTAASGVQGAYYWGINNAFSMTELISGFSTPSVPGTVWGSAGYIVGYLYGWWSNHH